MLDTYDGKGFSGSICGHGIVEAGGRGEAFIWLALDPMDGEAHRGPAEQTHVEGRPGFSDAAFVFLCTDIKALMQPAFDSPVLAIESEHLPGIELPSAEAGKQIFTFDVLLALRWPVNEALHFRSLRGMREAGLLRGDIKAQQTSGFRT